MNDRPDQDGVLKLLRLLADKLEDHLDGDDLALETLAESIEVGGWSADEMTAAILTLRGLSGAGGDGGWVDDAPGRQGARVPSAEERESLSTEAWGYLLDLRVQGTLDAEQFERVIERLTGSGVRPVSVELARDVAARVALEHEAGGYPGDSSYGDVEVAH